jgi:GLPGLI family protein
MKRLSIIIIYLLGNWINTYPQLPISLKKALYASSQSMNLTIPGSIILSDCMHLDTCLLKVVYGVTFVNDTLQKGKLQEDTQILEIGKHISHCFSYSLYRNDSLSTALNRRGVENLPSLRKYVIPEDVFTFYGKRQLEVLYRAPYLMPCYWYDEDIPQINWSLSEGQNMILGYKCQKAVCNFRGRNYIAWYTTDIPLKSGPYKFGGLPGLILAISDTKNEYSWICVGLKRGSINLFVNRYKCTKCENIRTTREIVRETIRHYHQDPAGSLILTGRVKGYVGLDGKVFKPVSRAIPPEPYNPIEKE